MDQLTQELMESRFGHDFSRVRVHTDVKALQAAAAVGAHAFTVNTDVVFGAGQYAPDTRSGRRLLAHELAHVVQQAGGIRRDVGQARDRYEREADAAADTVEQGRPAMLGAQGTLPPIGSAIQLQSIDHAAHPKTGENGDDEVKKIGERINRIYNDMDKFMEVWKVYNPDRVTLSGEQEMSLRTWMESPAHGGWDKTFLLNEFYQFLGAYYTSFKADPKYTPESVQQDNVLIELQMYLDGMAKKNPKYMDAWRKYDRAKLTGKQEVFLFDLENAGFSAKDFFRLLDSGFYH